VTVRLALVALAFEAVFGLLAGILAGIRNKSFFDTLVLISTTLIVSIPVFVLGFLAQYVLGLRLGLFPIAGLNNGFQSYLLPGFVLAALSLAYVARLTRTSLVENLRNDYVRTAKAKGLTPMSVVGKHTLRNSLIPVVTFLGVDLGALLSGAIVTEGIFNIPGLGRAVFDAVRSQEGAVVVGIVTLFVLVYIVFNLLVDVLYAALDPRIRYE
jgi:ABC-type dipeptide/oligopeptide/nickel transport system permease component